MHETWVMAVAFLSGFAVDEVGIDVRQRKKFVPIWHVNVPSARALSQRRPEDED
jgi:hypothetical protein